MLDPVSVMIDKKKRQQFIRYWISDVVFGIANIITHYSLRYVPLSINSLAGKHIGRLAGRTRFRKESDVCRHNLHILKPHMNEQEIDRFLKIMWGNIGKTMCEYSVLDKLWEKGCVDINNSEIIDHCLEKHEPIIFTGAHLGNWEVQASYCREHNIPLMAMYKPVRNRFSKWLANIARDRMRIYTVPTDRSAMKRMCAHLEEKRALWLPIDDQKKRQVHFPRFGRPLELKGTNAAFIVRLARKYHAAIIPVRTKRLDNSRPSLNISLYDALYVNEDGDIEKTLGKLNDLIESWVLEDIDQWYMLHELHL
jgi:KDO2-lipid IV(A) lauroyltransferase